MNGYLDFLMQRERGVQGTGAVTPRLPSRFEPRRGMPSLNPIDDGNMFEDVFEDTFEQHRSSPGNDDDGESHLRPIAMRPMAPRTMPGDEEDANTYGSREQPTRKMDTVEAGKIPSTASVIRNAEGVRTAQKSDAFVQPAPVENPHDMTSTQSRIALKAALELRDAADSSVHDHVRHAATPVESSSASTAATPQNEDVPKSLAATSLPASAALPVTTPVKNRNIEATATTDALPPASFAMRRNRSNDGIKPAPLPPVEKITPRREAAPRQPETNIHITIGRVEVRAVASPAAPARTRNAPQPMSLDEYLNRRNQRGPR